MGESTETERNCTIHAESVGERRLEDPVAGVAACSCLGVPGCNCTCCCVLPPCVSQPNNNPSPITTAPFQHSVTCSCTLWWVATSVKQSRCATHKARCSCHAAAQLTTKHLHANPTHRSVPPTAHTHPVAAASLQPSAVAAPRGAPTDSPPQHTAMRNTLAHPTQQLPAPAAAAPTAMRPGT